MPVSVSEELLATIKAVGSTLEVDKYTPVPGSLMFDNGETLEQAFPEDFAKVRAAAEAVGVDYDATTYTFKVVNKKGSKPNTYVQYVNFPAIWLLNEVPTLVWGDVRRPISELTQRGLRVETKASTSNKPGARPRYYLALKVESKFYKALGATEVLFNLSTVDECDSLTLAMAVDTDPSEAEYGTQWAEVLKKMGSGSGGGKWAQPLYMVLAQPLEMGNLSKAEFVEVVGNRLADNVVTEAHCEVIDIAKKETQWGNKVEMTLCDPVTKALYGKYQVGEKSQIAGAKAGATFKVTAERLGEMGGTQFISTNISEYVSSMAQKLGAAKGGEVSTTGMFR